MISGKHLYESVQTAIRELKRRRRDQAAFFVAALCFSGGFALTRKLVPDFKTDGWIARLQIALYAIGAIAFVYGAVRIWRLVNPPELPPAKDRPSAIKGPMAFTEADGELFRKLGRESELQKLLGLVLDDQILMVVIRGASGAGKTSLLRAGLNDIVGDKVVFHYWEAVPSEPDKGLLRAVQERWPEGAEKPATLADLVNPSDSLGRRLHVIVLDQFEQLRGNRKIFQLLRRIIRESRPPHRITWVIAFRREFSADWLDFISPEQENGVRPPQDVSLRLFTVDQAREVIGQLINESDLKDSIEQSVIDNLVEAATVDGEVSPVDIGIGLMVLSELRPRQSGHPITKGDYQFAGGAEGLLTQYITQRLELFPSESHEAILKAMLALRDPEENRQRLATGLTIDELAVEAGADARGLKVQLNRLADRDVRLLETETPKDGSAVRYRLPHERLIPALYRLTGKLLAEVDQAKLKFQNAFQAWQTNDKRSRYLLKGKELRLVQHYETQIPWGKDEQEKKNFLFRSKRRRQIARVAAVAAVLVLIGAGWFSKLQFERFEGRRYLSENGYTVELYDFQYQLKKLEMIEPVNLEHFTWVSSGSIEELSVKASLLSNSIAGLSSLSRCHSLKKLTLELGLSQVSDLQPLEQLNGLTQLSLNLSNSQVRDLQFLEQLKGLTQLSLNLSNSQIHDLQSLRRLKGLNQLSLNISGAQVSDLQPLGELKELTQLSLYLSGGQVSDLQPLAQLKGLTQLSLNLNNTQIRDLQPLGQLTALTQLSLTPNGAQMSDLQPLAQLKGLTQLSLNLTNSHIHDLQPLEQLKALKQLSLTPSGAQMNDFQPLAQLKGLTQLSLYLSNIQISDLLMLAQLKGLTRLSLYQGNTQLTDLQSLGRLKELTQLSLYQDSIQLTDLQTLTQLKGLTQLSLYQHSTQVTDLHPLTQLIGLAQLSLNFNSSDLKALEQLKELQRLTLDLIFSKVGDLTPLKQLTGLTQLTLRLNESQVINLEPVGELPNLQTLSIYNATRAQRMSLRKIPQSLVELNF